MTKRRLTPYAFFLKHAGYNITAGETKIQGQRRCARAMAEAEQWAKEENLTYRWEHDPDCGPDDFEFEADKTFVREHGAVGCVLVRPCMECAQTLMMPGDEPCKHDEVLGSLWGITESLVNADRDNYRRVVEAELALEVMP